MLEVVPLLNLEGKALGIRGGGVAQLVGEGFDDVFVDLLALFAHFGIRADGESVERNGALLGPFGEGLRKEIERGNEEENDFVFSGDLLGDFERGEGLAGAAGHDELATI